MTGVTFSDRVAENIASIVLQDVELFTKGNTSKVADIQQNSDLTIDIFKLMIQSHSYAACILVDVRTKQLLKKL